MATATAPAPTSNQPTIDDKTITLKGELCQFDLGSEVPNRMSFITKVKFSVYLKFFKVEPYDPVRGKGEQRESIETHIKKLLKEMRAGRFTPACQAGGLRDSHRANLVIDSKKGTASLVVKTTNPLPILDGGHRTRAMERMYREAATPELKKKIENLDVAVQIYLNPELITEDFQNLNAGKPVSRSQIKVMKEAKLIDDPEKGPIIKVMRRAINNMDKADDEDSFLRNDVNYIGGGGNRCDYSSITASNGSDIATTYFGGGKIVLYEPYRSFFVADKEKSYEAKAGEFLAECHMSIWRGIYKYGEKVTVDDPAEGKKTEFPRLLLDGMMLRPNRLGGRGGKSGTGFLIMVGNMFAFYMLHCMKKTKITPDHVKKFVAFMEDTLCNEIVGGGSGSVKREYTNIFVRKAFAEFVREDGTPNEADSSMMGGTDGIPILLHDHILTRSTLGVKSKKMEREEKSSQDEVRPKRLSDPDQTMKGFEDEDEPVTVQADDEDFDPDQDFVSEENETADIGFTG